MAEVNDAISVTNDLFMKVEESWLDGCLFYLPQCNIIEN